MRHVHALMCLFLLGIVPTRAHGDDEQSEAEVLAKFEAVHRAFTQRDSSFMREFYARDDEMLVFLEDRQLRGYDDVQTAHENVFAHARSGTLRSSYSNVHVDANGDMAYVAANFRLETGNVHGETTAETGRVTLVLERRDEEWVAVHRHASFQAPADPERVTPPHADSGPLSKPTLEGAWRSDKGASVIATTTHVATNNVSGMPDAATYRIAEEGLWVTPLDGAPGRARLVEIAELTSTELVLRLPGGAYTFRRVE